MSKRSSKPWYREFWVWLVLSPLILTVVVSFVMVSIAVRHADDTVSDTYYKDSRLYHFTADQDKRAKALGLAGMVRFARADNTITLELTGDLDYPQRLLLTLSHPVEADLDRHILLEQLSVGRYTGSVTGELKHRWYLRLMPELNPQEHQKAEWRLKGEINFDLGDSAPLNPAIQ
ncbi:FixH family protein [Microbulbifer thermotolerans]|uniref:FixH family protein n=1 Tax=Microbulbifer thermotolerans TaxID=252514 RepID=A0AB35I0T6_MICTH|nr:FixH family protein [Microbulbifer thermotolerans]MCX2802025.1 FixH family protein [Microbulbifer thermotolerans]MCX2842279.1 FixH family protein [Microbulbifer thermotolerans]WKT59584.1 FixH family protein [Microbulbifer thermotolerans]